MDSTLRNIYLHLDKRAETLARNALQQIIIKLIYSHSNRVSAQDLFNDFKKAIKRNSTSREEFDELLTMLVDNQLIKKSHDLYYLSSNKRDRIDKEYIESNCRKNRIIEKYFSDLYTAKSVLLSWFDDVTRHFFNEFSSDWISDLMDRTDSVFHNKSSINDIVAKRTYNIKEVDKRDYEKLISKFFAFVISDTDSDVIAYLWEYGTAAFSAKLISNQKGVNQLTLDTFRNSKCVLDTNILLYIALESNKFHKALVSIESAFSTLNIEARYLYITLEEYQAKVKCQERNTLHNIDVYGIDTTLEAEDDFTTTAKLRKCREKDDFVRFFNQISKIPACIHDTVEISLIDNHELNNAIILAQKDDAKKQHFNSIFSEVTGYEKRQYPLLHDVGLIGGTEHLRNCDKFFIMSEEIGVNSYSKEHPTSNNLPLSIRVLTFINILAIDNGGTEFNADDYMPLFASIIKNGLQPEKNAFDQVDLYKLYQLDANIAKLPVSDVRNIAVEMHDKMLKGVASDELRVDLERMITKGERAVRELLADRDSELYLKNQELSRLVASDAKKDKIMRDMCFDAKARVYDKETRNLRCKLWFRRTMLLGIIYITFNLIDCIIGYNIGAKASILLSIVASYIFDKYLFVKQLKVAIEDRKRNRYRNISELVTAEMNTKMHGEN